MRMMHGEYIPYGGMAPIAVAYQISKVFMRYIVPAGIWPNVAMFSTMATLA